jgi:hypothetical protein
VKYRRDKVDGRWRSRIRGREVDLQLHRHGVPVGLAQTAKKEQRHTDRQIVQIHVKNKEKTIRAEKKSMGSRRKAKGKQKELMCD